MCEVPKLDMSGEEGPEIDRTMFKDVGVWD